MKKLQYLACASLFLAGCSSPGIRGTYLSLKEEKNIRILSEQPVKGEDCRWFVLFVPVGTVLPVKAYNDAMSKAPKEATGLADARLSSEAPLVGGFLLSKSCIRVEGFPAVRTTVVAPQISQRK